MGSTTLSRVLGGIAGGVSVTGTPQTVAGIGNITIPANPSGFTESATSNQIPCLVYQVASVP
jgi:uncharacterized membrane protein